MILNDSTSVPEASELINTGSNVQIDTHSTQQSLSQDSQITDTDKTTRKDSLVVKSVARSKKALAQKANIKNFAESIPLKNDSKSDQNCTFYPEYFIKYISICKSNQEQFKTRTEQISNNNKRQTHAEKQTKTLAAHTQKQVDSISKLDTVKQLSPKAVVETVTKDAFVFYKSQKVQKSEKIIDYNFESNKPISSYTNQLQFNTNNSTTIQTKESSWILWFIVSGIALFIWLRMFYWKHIDNTLKACFSSHIASKLFRENNQVSLRTSLVLSLLFYANASLFIAQINNHLNSNFGGLYSFKGVLVITLILLVIYITKSFILNLLGFIFNAQKFVSEYLFSVYLYNKLFGLILFPIMISIRYLHVPYIQVQHVIYIGIGLWIATYLLRLWRGILITLRTKISIFYLILYLCILEIGPLMILHKVLSIIDQLPI